MFAERYFAQKLHIEVNGFFSRLLILQIISPKQMRCERNATLRNKKKHTCVAMMMMMMMMMQCRILLARLSAAAVPPRNTSVLHPAARSYKNRQLR